MSLFGDCAVKRAKYKPTTSALREYGICGFRAPDEDRDATPSSELRESAPLLGGDALPCCDGDGRRRRACSCAGLPCAGWHHSSARNHHFSVHGGQLHSLLRFWSSSK